MLDIKINQINITVTGNTNKVEPQPTKSWIAAIIAEVARKLFLSRK